MVAQDQKRDSFDENSPFSLTLEFKPAGQMPNTSQGFRLRNSLADHGVQHRYNGPVTPGKNEIAIKTQDLKKVLTA
jgi:hypothetical protein